MSAKRQHPFHRQTGFSLVELLVGLAIGLLASLVIMQVFSVFEGQKRTTTGSADAQTNGNIALFSIGRELKMAGFGLIPSLTSPLDCTTVIPGTTGITDLSPVVITDGGTAPGASDTITIHYASSASGGVPAQIAGVGVTAANDVTLSNNMGCQVPDIALVVNGSTCSFSKVTASSVVPPDHVTIGVDDPSIVPVVNTTNYSLACIGTWVTSTFRVNPSYDPTSTTNALAYLELNGAPSVADIVNVQAQYGISATATDNKIANWVNATGATWAAPSVADRNRIKAVHVAVVARNGLLEKEVVTGACTTAKGTANNGPCAWDDSNFDAAPAIDLSNDPNWQYYRYRVFDTIIPLRNMIWAKDTL